MITSQAVLIAIGIDWDGRRQVLAVELANRESRSSWRDFCWHSRRAVCTASNLSSPMIMPGSERRCARLWRRPLTSAAMCISSETRSTMSRAKSMMTACRELRWLYDRRDLAEARRDLAAWLAKWSGKYSKLSWLRKKLRS